MNKLCRYAYADNERLAISIHEAKREAVAKGKTLAQALGSPRYPFLEWNDLPEQAKEGHRMQAEYLSAFYHIIPRLEGEE